MAAASPGPMAIPGAAQYAQADTMATNAYNNALAQLNQNRMNTLTQYGYTGTVDPTTGVVGGVHVDPHSIYGNLQQMLHGQAVEDQNAQFAAEDRGLHGGLARQAGSELKYQHGAADTNMANTLQGTLSGYQDQQQQAAETRDNALWQAEQAQAEAALQAQEQDDIATLLAQLSSGSGDGSGGGSGGGDGGGSGGGGGGPAVTPVPSSDAYIGTVQVNPDTLARAFSGGSIAPVKAAEAQSAKAQAIKKILGNSKAKMA